MHKSIRQRLKFARSDEISSAYDLALIIIDEASRVFFDRTKTNDKQPNMVDLFADAIRGVVCHPLQTTNIRSQLLRPEMLTRRDRHTSRPRPLTSSSSIRISRLASTSDSAMPTRRPRTTYSTSTAREASSRRSRTSWMISISSHGSRNSSK